MSSSLDKLKALSNRLGDKLEEKGKGLFDTPVTPNPSPQKEEVLSQQSLTSKTEVVKEEPPKRAVERLARSVLEKSKKSVANDYQSSQNLSESGGGADRVRRANTIRVKQLYEKLKIYEKSSEFENIFIYKAMNLSGISLKEDDFAQVREGKYIQIIAITYEPDKNGKKKAKNISLGYFGKAETLDVRLKNEIIEFVLRWRYEKAFQNVEHYKDLIAKVHTTGE